MGLSLKPTAVDLDGKQPIQISGGFVHTCFLLDDQTSMKCVGYNAYGQLGKGDRSQRGNLPSNTADKFQAIDLGSGILKIKYIESGKYFNCVIYVDNSFKCFGDGQHGNLGSGKAKNVGAHSGEMGVDLPMVDVFSTKSPTSSPTKPICSYSNKEKCKKDKRCSWITSGNQSKCIPINCSSLNNKDDCLNTKICNWTKGKCKAKTR